MPVTVKRIDLTNKRVYFNVEVGAETTLTVQEAGSAIKNEFQKAPFIDDDAIFTWSGAEEFITASFTGVVMFMLDGWTIWTEDQPSQHKFRFTEGLILVSGGANPLGSPDNVTWSLSEQAVSSVTEVTSTTGATKRSLNV